MSKTIGKSILKDLPLKLQDASIKARVDLLTTLRSAFEIEQENEDTVPSELAAKSLAKILPMVLPRYMDAKSRQAILELLKVLLKHHTEATGKVLSQSLNDTFSCWANIVPSLFSVKVAMFALQWTSQVIHSFMEKR